MYNLILHILHPTSFPPSLTLLTFSPLNNPKRVHPIFSIAHQIPNAQLKSRNAMAQRMVLNEWPQ